jgi:hypothetical protein
MINSIESLTEIKKNSTRVILVINRSLNGISNAQYCMVRWVIGSKPKLFVIEYVVQDETLINPPYNITITNKVQTKITDGEETSWNHWADIAYVVFSC